MFVPALAAMHWLPTNDAIVLATLCVGVAVPLSVSKRESKWVSSAGAVFRELALVLALYSLWGIAGRLAATQPIGAIRHGQWVWDAERWLHIPNEKAMQDWLLPHVGAVRALNMYYAFVHAPSLIIFLVWLFFRHRDRYPFWRNTLAFLTLSCLLVQLIPVAPPRLIPALGIIDTGQLYGPTVYPPLGQGGPDQFSAMPSVHVGWAALFTLAVVVVSTSRWRWLVLGHLLMTLAAVTFTGYHFLLDGIVAMALIGTSALLAYGLRLAHGALRRHANPGRGARVREPAGTY